MNHLVKISFLTICGFALNLIPLNALAQNSNQQLAESACVGVNSFLQQVNILSIINQSTSEMSAEISYRDASGIVQEKTNLLLQADSKRDIIVNDLGLTEDTIGTVCITNNSPNSSWSGGITIFKPSSNSELGDSFDYALYYPLLNPFTGSVSASLNTFHLGMPESDLIANWISISDSNSNDNIGINGRLDFFDEAGGFITARTVDIPNGGRRDFDAHVALSGISNENRIGSVRFSPNLLENGESAQFHLTNTRYFYECPDGACSDFRTAFVVPIGSSDTNTQFSKVSGVKNEISIIEIVNPQLSQSNLALSVQNEIGAETSTLSTSIQNLNSSHLIFAGESESSVSINSNGANAVTVFYLLDDFGNLEHAYASPFSSNTALELKSQFNSFLGTTNTGEFQNTSNSAAQVEIFARDFDDNIVFSESLNLEAGQRSSIKLALPQNKYGTITILSDTLGVLFNNTVTNEGQYTLQFPSTIP